MVRQGVNVEDEDFTSELVEESDLKEQQFAAESGMDTIYWCWNCIHSECCIHFKKG